MAVLQLRTLSATPGMATERQGDETEDVGCLVKVGAFTCTFSILIGSL